MSTIRVLCAAFILAALSVIFAPPAFAVTSTTVVVTDAGQPVPSGSVRLFDTATGAEVKQEEDDDDDTALFLLPGGNYRIEVGGKPVKEITVTGEGSETVTAELGGGGAVGDMLFGPNGPALHVGVEGAFLWRGGDDFVDGNLAQPDSGIGARAFAALEFDNRYLLRGGINGSWLNDGKTTPLGMGLDLDEDAELDAFWATLELFYLFALGERSGGPYPATQFGIGGGLEYADLEHSFTEKLVFPLGTLSETQQETSSWGIGPRVSAFGKHALGDSHVWLFGEAGAALLFGNKDSERSFDGFGMAFSEQDGESERILHLNARIGLAYDFLAGGIPAALYAGYQYDRFNNTINQQFLPDRQPGDNVLHGPFFGMTFKLWQPPLA